MELPLQIIFMSLLPYFAIAITEDVTLANADESVANISDPNKDMYVIHAMVYQVGIITNKTDEQLNNTNLNGNQEAVTFYQNASGIDWSSIPAPLMTNVTAGRLVAVAPAPAQDDSSGNTLPWAHLEKLATVQQTDAQDPDKRQLRQIADDEYDPDEVSGSDYLDEDHPYWKRLYERSIKEPENKKTPVEIVSGSAVIPQNASVQSISIPSLLTLNNNFSEIPVPIPNTSVVHYAKVNTLIHAN